MVFEELSKAMLYKSATQEKNQQSFVARPQKKITTYLYTANTELRIL